MTKIIVDAAFAAVLLLASIYLWFVADAFPKFARYKNIDADFWPKSLLVIIAVVALILLYQSLSMLHVMRKASRISAGEIADEAPSLINWKKFGLASLLVIAYFVGLQTLGFLISTVIFLALAIRLIGYENRLLLNVYPFAFTAIITAVFVKVLAMQLPRGLGVFESFSRLFY